jgi:hypothetical protein
MILIDSPARLEIHLLGLTWPTYRILLVSGILLGVLLSLLMIGPSSLSLPIGIGESVAIVLALLGTMGLVGYVQGAKDDAVAGEKLVKVYVVNDAIPAGTSASSLTDRISTEKVPAKVKADDAVTNLKSVKGKVTTVNLVAGEQLVQSRFGSSVSTSTTKGVPAGMFAATVSLSAHQKAADYTLAKGRLAMAGLLFNAALLVGWTLLGGLDSLNQWVNSWGWFGSFRFS